MATRIDNDIVLLSHWALWFILFVALLLRSNVPEADNYNLAAVGMVVVVVVLFVPLSALIAIAFALWNAAIIVSPAWIVLIVCLESFLAAPLLLTHVVPRVSGFGALACRT